MHVVMPVIGFTSTSQVPPLHKLGVLKHTEPDSSSARHRSTLIGPTQVGTELGTAVGNGGFGDGCFAVGSNVGDVDGIGVVG